MLNVDPITVVELFKIHLTVSAAKEFQQIIYLVSDSLFEKHIEVEFNMRVCRWNVPEKMNANLIDDALECGCALLSAQGLPIRRTYDIGRDNCLMHPHILSCTSRCWHSPPRWTKAPLKRKKAVSLSYRRCLWCCHRFLYHLFPCPCPLHTCIVSVEFQGTSSTSSFPTDPSSS